MGDHASFSIVIPTHNRAKKIAALLASIDESRIDSLDSVIVVDDSDAPNDLVGDFPSLPLEHIILDRRIFISKAKNMGWNRATGDFVYFIDDDNCVTHQVLETPFKTILSSPGIGAIVPAVLYKRRQDIVWVYSTPLSPGKWAHELLGRNLPRNPSFEGKLMETDALPNASLIRREALVEIGGFREDLVVNSSADAALRLKSKGWKVYAHTGVFMLHDVEPPGHVGYWSEHGVADPDRVYHEVHDWFLLMRLLHPADRLFPIAATFHALGFILPNSLAYFLRGGVQGRRSLEKLLRGYLAGLRATATRPPSLNTV